MPKLENLAIVPARGGSKGVPRKNLRELAGKPLLAYGVGCALAATSIDRTVVTTDDDEIAAVARALGAEVVERPPELATDAAPTEPAMRHVVETLEARGIAIGHIALIQCTCPFRLAADVDAGFALLGSGAGDAVMSVSEVPAHFHPYWQKRRDEHGHLVSLFTEPEVSHGILETGKYWRRQDLPGTYYWKNGALYIFPRDSLMVNGHRYGTRCLPLVLDAARLVNIDDENDFLWAEFLLQKGRIALDF